MRQRKRPAARPDHRYIEFVGHVRGIAGVSDFDAQHLARRTLDFPTLVEGDRDLCGEARRRIGLFLAALHDEIIDAKQKA